MARRGRRHHHKRHHTHRNNRKTNPIASLLIILCRILQGGFILYAGLTIISRIISIVKYINIQNAVSTPASQSVFLSTHLTVVAGYLWQILIALIIGIVATLIIEFVIRTIKERKWR